MQRLSGALDAEFPNRIFLAEARPRCRSDDECRDRQCEHLGTVFFAQAGLLQTARDDDERCDEPQRQDHATQHLEARQVCREDP